MIRNSSTTFANNMIAKQLRSVSPRRLAGAAALSLALLGGCSSSDILEVVDPDILNPGDINTAIGAQPLRYGAIRDFVDAFDGTGDSFAVVTGTLADELRASDTFDGRLLVNKRQMNDNLPEMTGAYNNLHTARASINNAITVIGKVAPTPKFNVGELQMYRGYVEDFFGEMYCSGVPFSTLTDEGIELGMPETTVQVYTRAVASFDSALANADTSTKVRYAAAVGKGRALLNLGQFAAAAAAVSAVPTTFKLNVDHCNGTGCTENALYSSVAAPNSRYTPATKEGVNGLDFLPAVADPRLPWAPNSRQGFNSEWKNMPIPLKVCPAYRPCTGTFNTTGANVLADGIEARLIEAEARLQGGTQADRDAVFATLNTLRATGIPGRPVTALTTAPTTQNAAVDLLFAERGYWMYLTGHRLGDMRRLVRQYGRNAETVFPTGEEAFPRSGVYGTDVAFPIPATEKNNPNFTGCLDTKA